VNEIALTLNSRWEIWAARVHDRVILPTQAFVKWCEQHGVNGYSFQHVADGNKVYAEVNTWKPLIVFDNTDSAALFKLYWANKL
jgi:hypothetical protein